MSVFTANILYLTNVSGFKQKYISDQTGIAESTISNWKKDAAPPRKGTLKRLANFFTSKLNLPPDLLGDGSILIEKDISKAVEQHLQKKVQSRGSTSSAASSDTEKLPPGVEFTIEELSDLEALPIVDHIREIPEYDIKAGAGQGQAVVSEKIKGYTKVFPDISPRVKFAVRAHGHSMELAGIHDGDLLFIAPVEIKHLRDGDVVIISDNNGDLLVKYFQRQGEKILLLSASSKFRPIITDISDIRIIGKVMHSSHLKSF